MFKLTLRLLLAACICVASLQLSAQTARLQVIHNSPTPTVDIYVNGNLFLDNFAFRTATPFTTVPAGVDLNIGVALGTSTSVRDTLVNFRVRLDANKAYVVIANGIVGNAQTPFTLAVADFGRETSSGGNANVDLAFFHGSPGAPSVDILAGTAPLFLQNMYGRFSQGYASVPASNYTINVRATGQTTNLASYAADFSFWRGKTAVIFASGFLNGNPSFEPWVALSNGGTFPLRAITPPPPPPPTRTARLQIIHNSPTPTVDIYVNGSLFLDNFAFRTATPFTSVPAGVDLNVGVALGTSTSVRDTLVNFRIRLDSGKTYVVVANGIVGNAQRPFTLSAADFGRETSSGGNANVDLAFFHGSPDAPSVDILAGTAPLFLQNTFGRFSQGYASVPASNYTINVRATGQTTNLASYAADFSFWKGRTAVIFASGFLNGSPSFEPWVALSNGGTFPLRRVTPFVGQQRNESFDGNNTVVAREIVGTNRSNDKLTVYPNPVEANGVLNVVFATQQTGDMRFELLNLAGQTLQSGTWSADKGDNNYALSTQDMPTGTYLLRTKTATAVSVQKITVFK